MPAFAQQPPSAITGQPSQTKGCIYSDPKLCESKTPVMDWLVALKPGPIYSQAQAQAQPQKPEPVCGILGGCQVSSSPVSSVNDITANPAGNVLSPGFRSPLSPLWNVEDVTNSQAPISATKENEPSTVDPAVAYWLLYDSQSPLNKANEASTTRVPASTTTIPALPGAPTPAHPQVKVAPPVRK